MSLTLAAILFGYLLGFLIVPRLITQERFLELSCICGVILTLMAFLTPGYVAIRCIALLGAANDMVMPTIFPIAVPAPEHRWLQPSSS
ncbi:hypothetical protein [Gluconobacter oxydans]|uniref:hypothetical protein n=1 Tax=Gluconobacter oxydans TaxID=442 RepID=UPI0039E9AE2E